jgi:pimeloyl-ACP methyl ester carboxylesterase
MPHIELNGANIWYEDTGGDGETLLFAHGLLWSRRMFDEQVKYLRDRYRCITFDFRGQGKSEVTESGYDMDSLTVDVVELIRKLDCGPVHFAGLSMGGFIGLRVGFRHPELLSSLIIIESTADPEPEENLFRYKTLNFIARWLGFGLVSEQVMPIMFGKKFLEDPERAELRARWKNELVSNDRKGTTRAVRGVYEREGVYEQLGGIITPTLILIGDQDTATVPAKSEGMHAAIDGSKLVYIKGAGHSSTIEEPEQVNAAIDVFLEDLKKKNG